MIKHCYNWTT